ncbi:superoxide dismutase [Cu-Zn]-like isoform X2 [Pieris brassicae]|uniref:superoxide dismutase [Cu-Zn]-like isoform X2 n=1 Tax=Pieris brassicae TaxID=7116 RepID=UPI001E65FE4F|nr:superoxide dismutase [Cu-Zn]-like isoform X2 [Pieris brassicae]
MNLRLHVFFGQLLWIVSVLNGKTVEGIPGYGRNLIIKSLPAIEDFQSNVYEVIMEPYLYDPRSIGLRAIAYLKADQDSGVTGELVFRQVVPNGPVVIEGNVTGLPAGLHGLHIHQSGAVKENCQDIGPHFIAYYGRHGGPRDNIRHVGDLGNIKAEEEILNVKIIDHLISLAGPRSIVGRSIAISKSEDDYGRSSTEDSALTGTSGPAIACGVIGYLN